MPGDVTDWRIKDLESHLAEIKDAIKAIERTLAALTILETKHQETRESLNRAFTKIESNDRRITMLENQAPEWRETSKWVKAAAAAIMLAAFSTFWKLLT